jgi:hypothetical protein
MKTIKTLTLLIPLVFLQGANAEITTDLWDLSQGATVISSSPVQSGSNYSDVRNMFGGDFGYPEIFNTVYADYLPAGTLHWVEWQAASPVNLQSFQLDMAHDAPPRDANYRGVETFRLFYRDDSNNLVKLFEISPANPYGDTVAPPNATVTTNESGNLLVLCVNTGGVNAQSFRAEFVQYGDIAVNASGPRVRELDGFETGCPGLVTDSDGDGIDDAEDLCPATPLDAVVNGDGCSLDQLVPCDGDWANHGDYVKAVMETASDFADAGLITPAERRQIVSDAGKSDCGK